MNKLSLILIALVIIIGGFIWYRSAQSPTPSESVRITRPLPDSLVSSPLVVQGEALGMWYFEASFPIKILDADRKEIAVSHAEAQGEWMTQNFVPFIGTIEFAAPASDTGFLVLEKDNPSGLPEHAAQIEIPVRFR